MALWNNISEIQKMADMYYFEKHFHEAICCYDMLISKDSSDPKLYRERGRCYIQTRDMEKAVLDFFEEAQCDPRLPTRGMKKKRAKILFIAELYELDRTTDGNKEMALLDASQLMALGDELYNRNEFYQAQEAYSMAIEKEPYNAVCYAKRGQFSRNRNILVQATTDYQKALSLDQSSNNYLIELVEVLLIRGHYRTAKEILHSNDRQLKKVSTRETDLTARIETARQNIIRMENDKITRQQREEEARYNREEEERQRKIELAETTQRAIMASVKAIDEVLSRGSPR